MNRQSMSHTFEIHITQQQRDHSMMNVAHGNFQGKSFKSHIKAYVCAFLLNLRTEISKCLVFGLLCHKNVSIKSTKDNDDTKHTFYPQNWPNKQIIIQIFVQIFEQFSQTLQRKRHILHLFRVCQPADDVKTYFPSNSPSIRNETGIYFHLPLSSSEKILKNANKISIFAGIGTLQRMTWGWAGNSSMQCSTNDINQFLLTFSG